MQRASATSTPTPRRSTEKVASHLLCAYSPRWLSGPTPGYEGLCPTWVADEPDTAEHEAISVG